MCSESELQVLIAAARSMGCTVTTEQDKQAKREEGRDIIESVQVSGLNGFGPFAMSPIYFAEKMRGHIAKLASA